jgi:hypothetical protein
MSDTLKTIITVLLSGGFLTFLQFMINRYDSKHNRFKELQDEFHAGLDDRENRGKERYDEHKEAIEELRKAMLALSTSTQETQKLTTAVSELVVGLGQDKIVYLTDKYRNRGGITLKEKAGLEAIYTPYHDKLRGNGYGKIGFDYRMKELPIISEEEAIEKDKIQ